MADTVPEDFFRICHYDLKEPATFALACDESYLYLCISSRNGGIYKIGTGNGTTKAGKLYTYKQMALSAEHVKMVVIGDTIYRSYQSCEFATIKTNNKHTLEPMADIELNCPLIRSEPLNLKINKCLPIMTDGTHLYAIFKSVELDPIDESVKQLPATVPAQEKPVPPTEGDRQEILKSLDRFGGGYRTAGGFGLFHQEIKPPTSSIPSKLLKPDAEKLSAIHSKMLGSISKEQLKRVNSRKSSDRAPPQTSSSLAVPEQAPGQMGFFPTEHLEIISEPMAILDNHPIEEMPVLPPPPPPAPPAQPAEPVQSDPVKEPVPPPKPAEDKIFEFPDWMMDIVEGYFTPEREKEIEDRWAIVVQKRGDKIGSCRKNSAGQSEGQGNLHVNKNSSSKAPTIASKKKAKAKEDKPATKTAPVQPAEPEKDRTGIMSFYLYKYNLSHSLEELKEEDYKNSPAVLELHESFAGLFTILECARAYKLSHEDIVLSAQWLIEEGEKQRNKRFINYEQTTLLCQGEIDPKCLKAKAPKSTGEDIVLLQSIITERHLLEECIFYDGTILIGRNFYFSSDPKDEYELPDELIPQILQDKKFITPERTRASMRSYVKQRDSLSKDRDGKFDLDMLEMDNQMKTYYSSIMTISQELHQLNSRGGDLNELELQNRILLEAKMNTIQAKLSLEGKSRPPEAWGDDLEKELALTQPVAAAEVKTDAPAPTEAKKSTKKLRGTFICKSATALERQEGFAPRCYDQDSNLLYALNMVKKNPWIQNPSLIVKSRDPICYSKMFKFTNKVKEVNLSGKIFFEGTKEVEYGHADNGPALLEDQKKYFDKFKSEWEKLESLKGLRAKLNIFLTHLNTKRFSLPFKPSNTLEALTKMHRELESQIKRSSNPEEKKSMQAKKTKIGAKIAKLERVYKDIKFREDLEDKELEEKLKIVKVKSEKDVASTVDQKVADPASAEGQNQKKASDKVKSHKESAKMELVENKKQYCFCPIGSRCELNAIFGRLKTSIQANNTESIEFYLNMLLFWSYHMSVWVKWEKAHELTFYLLDQLEEAKLGSGLLSIMESVVIRMIYFVGSNTELVQRILKLALKKKMQATQSFEEIREKLNCLDYLHLSLESTSLLEKAYIILCRVKHYDIYHVFNQAEQILLVNDQSRVRQQEPKHKLNKTFGLPIKEGETISDLQESSLFQLLLQLQESIIDNGVNSDLLVKWRIYFGHYFNVWTLIEGKARDEKVQRFINEFVNLSFAFIERYVEIIDRDNLKNIEAFSIVLEYVLCMVNITTCYLINAKSSTRLMVNADFLATKNLKIMGGLMKIFKKVDCLAQGKISSQLNLQTEGIDINQQSFFETCHPLNRGETAKTNTMSFPDALGLVVQLDKRCQSDSGKDFLLMHSWLNTDSQAPTSKTEMNINSNSNNKLNIGIGFRVSGKMKNEDTFLLLGDTARMSFDANPKALDSDQSLKRWGYRLRSIPMYGYETTLQIASSSEKIPAGVQSSIAKYRTAGLILIQMMSRLTVTLLREIDLYMKGRRVNLDEKRVGKFLQWNLLKSGLSSLKRELFLQDLKQGLKLTDKMKDSLGKVVGGADDTQSKGRSIEETEKMSAQSRGELEKEFLQDTQLAELLSKLQGNDAVLTELIRSVKSSQDVPMALKMEKMRPTFTKELQKIWENSENLILLAMLHHSGLLNLLVSSAASNRQITNLLSLESVKEQLVEICKKKNDILNKMLGELQIERELQITLNSMLDLLKQEVQKIKEERESHKADVEIQNKKPEEMEDKTGLDEKESKKAKLEELQKKYTKKKVGKKSDYVQPKKEKDSKKKDKVDPKAKKLEEPEKVEEKKPEDAQVIPEEPKIPELFFETFIEKPEIKEQLTALLKNSRLSESSYTEFILATRNLSYQVDDQQSNQTELMSHLRSILLKAENDLSAIENPYVKVANKIDERCFFLLKIATSFLKSFDGKNDNQGDDMSAGLDGESDEDLQPIDISRSLSSTTGPLIGRKNSNRIEAGMEGLEKRVDVLQEWINSYAKWKSSEKSDLNLESEKCSFLVSISYFLTHREPIEIKRLERVLLRIAQRACCRALGLDMIKDFLNFAHDTWLGKYLIGVFSAPFK